MTEQTSDKNVNFYLSPPGGGDVKNEPVIYKDYIISQNQMVQSNLLELTRKNIELENEKVVLEEENDHYDVSARYMKSEMKNFVELAKMHDEVRVLSGKTTDLYLTLNASNDALIKRMACFLILSKSAFCVFSMINWYSGWVFPVVGVDLSTCAFLAVCLRLTPGYASRWMKANKDNIVHMNNINAESKQILDAIKKTDDSNDFISKYIDNL